MIKEFFASEQHKTGKPTRGNHVEENPPFSLDSETTWVPMDFFSSYFLFRRFFEFVVIDAALKASATDLIPGVAQ